MINSKVGVLSWKCDASLRWGLVEKQRGPGQIADMGFRRERVDYC